MQDRGAFRPGASVEARAKGGIRGGGIEIEPVEERADVEARAADDERHPPARRDVRERGAGIALEPRRVVRLAGIDDVDAVVTDARLLRDRRLGRPDIHPAVHLPRVRRNDLPAGPLRGPQRERALPRCGRSDDRDDVQGVASMSDSARRASATVVASGSRSP